MRSENVAFVVFVVLFVIVEATSAQDVKSDVGVVQIGGKDRKMEFVGRMLEEGRTLVHNTVKRFMVILPAIFFKLGIAFTLLVLVTIVAVNNGFIGFMLLVVGLSSVLARLQEARRPAATPLSYISPAVSPYYSRGHFLDRSDTGVVTSDKTIGGSTGESSYAGNYQYYRPSLATSGYTAAYYGQNRS